MTRLLAIVMGIVAMASQASAALQVPDLTRFAHEWKLVASQSDSLCAPQVSVMNPEPGRLNFHFVGNYGAPNATRVVPVTLGKSEIDGIEIEGRLEKGVLRAKSSEKKSGRKATFEASITDGVLRIKGTEQVKKDKSATSCAYEPRLAGVLDSAIGRCAAFEGAEELGSCRFESREDGTEACVISGVVLDEKELRYYRLVRDDRGSIQVTRPAGSGRITLATRYDIAYRERWESEMFGKPETHWSERTRRFPVGLDRAVITLPHEAEASVAQVRCFFD